MKTTNKWLLSWNDLLLAIGLLLFMGTVQAGESFIPLQKGLRTSSDDLVYNGKVLSSREAQTLETSQKIDLSTLNPKNNDLWDDSSENIIEDQSDIAIEEGDFLSYEGALQSNSGLFRFNAIPVNGNKIFTIHLDKSLHTMLLRKNLLRKLGYKIPAMKYVRKLSVQFATAYAMENFLKREVPEATLGASERWATVTSVSKETLVVDLQDVAVSEPNEFDFYNVSMGIPTQTINSRTLKSLIIPYSVTDLHESLNKFSWVNGKVDNQAVILSHFTANDFNTTVDDAQWMIRKLNKLTREDFKSIVADAYFPSEAGPLLVEKLIARRNSLNRLFSTNISDISYNSKLTIGKTIVDGKLIQKEFPGYASRFSYGDAESPLEQLRFFLYSKIQSNVLDNAVLKFNEKLSAFDLSEARIKYFQKQFKEGLDHFVETGELLPIGVGAWVSPVVDARFIFSRDIVLGNYLGTDNLVQLADTFGASADLGFFVGIEGLGNDLSSSVKVTTSLVRSYTHLKPVKNLKASLKEPYKNIFVSLLKRSLKQKFFSLSEIKNSKEVTEEKNKQIQELLKEIESKLDVGESLLITHRLMPSAAVKLNFNQGLIGAGVGVAGGVSVIKRIHLYKKSPKILQIYDDEGFVKNLDFSMQVSNYIPILRANAKFDNGHYGIKSYMVNLSGDLEENPNLFSNALGVYNVLKDKNFELLEVNNPPVSLDAQYKDRTTGLSFLFWRLKAIKGKTQYDIKAKDGVNGKYFSVNKDFMRGFNIEAFSKQLVNYYLSTKTDDFSITEEADNNPGSTFFGSAYTQNIRYEASLNSDNRFEQKFLSLSDVKEGWAVSQKSLKKFMLKVNKKFNFPLFETDHIDFSKLRLFRVGYHVNVYNKGIERLSGITQAEINPIEQKYRAKKACWAGDDKYDTLECGDLGAIKNRVRICQKSKNDEDVADCNVELIEQLMNDLEFEDFQKLIGEKNMYVYGSIDGFREKSEILNDTIYSNSIGKIGSKQWDGPLDVVKNLLGLSGGEFSGSWIRTGL
jgi:hypothetical protein